MCSKEEWQWQKEKKVSKPEGRSIVIIQTENQRVKI